MKRVTHRTEMSYENCIVNQEKKIMDIYLPLAKANKTDYDMKKAESEDQGRSIKTINEKMEKEKEK
jgi:hypothetical protein